MYCIKFLEIGKLLKIMRKIHLDESTNHSQHAFHSLKAIVQCLNTLQFIAYHVRLASPYQQRLQFLNTNSLLYALKFTAYHVRLGNTYQQRLQVLNTKSLLYVMNNFTFTNYKTCSFGRYLLVSEVKYYKMKQNKIMKFDRYVKLFIYDTPHHWRHK